MGSAHAQSDKPWDGSYAGINVGGMSNHGCASAGLVPSASEAPLTDSPHDTHCSGTEFVGGIQLGENLQIGRLILGVSTDIDASGGKDVRTSQKNVAATPPSGTYVYSSDLNPRGFSIIGGRIGYAGDVWLPYLRAGGVLALRPRAGTLSVTAPEVSKSTASFSEGAASASTGWAAGAGADIGLNGAWSITAEFLHVTLGGAAESRSRCSGPSALCSAFSGVALETQHGGLSANLIRVGVNYWFGYWDPVN